jgi:hypothetical protein
MPIPQRLRIRVLLLVLGSLVTTIASSAAEHQRSKVVRRQAEHSLKLSASSDGWDKARPANQTRTVNLFLAQYGPEGTARAVRQSLIEAALPDLRIFLAIGTIILLLRLLRNREQTRFEMQATGNIASGNQLSTAPAAQEAKTLKAA